MSKVRGPVGPSAAVFAPAAEPGVAAVAVEADAEAGPLPAFALGDAIFDAAAVLEEEEEDDDGSTDDMAAAKPEEG